MEEKRVYQLDYKKAAWSDFSQLVCAESEKAAKEYIEVWHPEIMFWYRRFGNLYARRRLDDMTILTYRICSRSLVTEEEVAMIRQRRADSRAARAAIAAMKEIVE